MDVSVIGTGLMGQPMARRLVACGHRVTVFNRTASKAVALAAAGATVAPSAEAAVATSEVVVTMLSDGPAVVATLLAEPVRRRLNGRTVLQTSTIGPGESRDLAAAVAAAGGDYLEAPVLGSVAQAADGSLIVLAGGDEATFARLGPLLRAFGPQPRLLGPVGAAASVKLALNQLIVAETAAIAWSLAYLASQGLAAEPFMTILRSSALYAPTFDKKLAAMLARDFAATNFPARLLLKDVGLMRAEAAAAGLETATLEAFARIVQRALDLGHGEHDYASLFLGVADPARP